MKNRFLFSVLLLCAQTVPASAEYKYRNDPTDAEHVLEGYRTNAEYMAGTLGYENINGYALTAIGADKAYTGANETAYGGLSGNGVVIGFLTPFGTTHEDLSNQISTGGASGADDNEWGSRMAGVMVAEKNATGMHGVAYNAKILPLGGMSDQEAYSYLANDEAFNHIKIITAYDQLSSAITAEELSDWAKDRLFINANDNEYLASWLQNSELKNNVINVASYDPRQTPDSDSFIGDGNSADYFATGVEKWTLTAPGTFYVPNTAGENPTDEYAAFSSSDLATAAVAGAAALVQEAFPTINGKLIADILFSTALKKEDLEDPEAETPKYLSPYMIQDNFIGAETPAKRFIFFTDNTQGIESIDDAKVMAGWSCDEATTTCYENELTFEEFFGQGLLNVAEVTKGPKYFDAERSVWDGEAEQFFYEVKIDNTVADPEPGEETGEEIETKWTWSNNIGEKLMPEPFDFGVGLKKTGRGTLILTGNNTFSGASVVEDGKLVLTGSMTSSVTVNGGTFFLNGGTLSANLATAAAGQFSSEGGILNAESFTNAGTANTQDSAITLTGDITNAATGQFISDNDTLQAGNLKNSGTFSATNGSSITLSGDMTNLLSGQFTLDDGSLEGAGFSNRGTFSATNGSSITLSDDIGNFSGGTFTLEDTDLEGTNFSNSGTFSAQTGTITLSGDITNTGTGQFTLEDADLEGTNFSNSGTFSAQTGTIALTGSVTNAEGGELTLEDITLTGTTFSNLGTFSATNGTMTITETVENVSGGEFTLDNITLTGTTFSNAGTFIAQNGTMTITETVENVSGGEFTLSNSDLTGTSFSNAGTFIAQKGTIHGDVTNTGLFKATAYESEQGNITIADGALINSNTVSLENNSSFTGTIENEARIQVTGNARFIGTINNAENGGLVFSNGKTLTLASGAIINDGTLTGNGTVFLDNGEMRGNFVFNDGQVSVQSGTITGNVTTAATGHFLLNGGTLVGNVTNQSVFTAQNARINGNIDNTKTFNVTENTQLNGTLNNISGSTAVGTGKTLTVASGTVENSGYLTGSGTINGIVNNKSNGSVGTSLTIGTLNSSGKIILEEINDEPVAMNVGTLNINGGSFTVSMEGKPIQRGDTYTLINFDTLNMQNSLEQQRLSYFTALIPVVDDHKLQAVVEYVPMDEEELEKTFTPEERKTIEAIDKMSMSPAVFNRINSYTPEEMKKQVETLRTKALPVQNEQLPLTNVMASQVNARLFTNNMIENAADVWRPNAPRIYHRGRSGGQIYTPRAQRHRKVWGQMLGGFSKQEEEKELNRKAMTTRSVGAMFGYDYEFSEKFLLGVLAGTSSAKMNGKDNKVVMRDYRAGLYTASRFGQVTLNTVLTGGFQQYDTKRYLEIFGEDETSVAKYNGYSAEFDVNLGVDFMRVPYRDYSFFLRSYVSANVNYVSQDAYKEKGNSFLALGVKSMHNTAVTVSPGLTLGYNFYALTETVLTADFSYQRLVHGERTNASAYFLADAEKTVFTMSPVDSDKNAFNAGLGLKTKLGRSWQLYLYAAARKSKKTETLNLAATFSYNF